MFSLRQTFFIAVVFSAVMQSHSDLIPPQLSVYQTTKYFICISINHQFNFSTVLWIFLLLLYLADEKSHPLRLSRPSRDESYFSAHSAKKSPLLNPWPSGFLSLPFRRRKRGTGLVNPAPRFRPLHFSGQTVCTCTAFTVGFCGASRPAPPDLKQGTECSPYSAGKRVNMEYLPLPQPLFQGGQGFYIPCHQNAF